jgi:hypothetical protein
MKGLLVVAGLATAAAVVSGALLLGSAPAQTGHGPGQEPERPVRAPVRDDGPDVEALATRIRALEARIAELQATAAPPAPAAATGPEERRRDEARRAAAGTDVPWDMSLEEFVRVYGDRLPAEDAAEKPVPPPKKDANPPAGRFEREIRTRVDRFAEALALTEFEKTRAEEIVRDHLDKALAIAARAKESLKGSSLGYTAAERAQVTVFQQERERLNRETEQAFSLLVGPERLAQFLKAEKAQAEKEAAVKKLERPW